MRAYEIIRLYYFNNFILYIMITKFECYENYNSIEFKRELNNIFVNISCWETGDFKSVRLSESDLFDLIGQLLRMQSEIRKEVQNG